MNAPWNTLFLVIILWVFVSVFLGLLPRTLCRMPNYIRLMGIWVMLGQLLSVYIMVVPSLQHDGHYHIFMGLHELLITLGFVGAFFLCYLAFLGKLPILPISDKHLCRTWHGHWFLRITFPILNILSFSRDRIVQKSEFVIIFWLKGWDWSFTIFNHAPRPF